MTQPDSRVLRLSVGSHAVTKPLFTQNGQYQRTYCHMCGRPAGWSSLPEDGLTGILVLCDPCHERYGAVPLPLLGHTPD